jgi:hypothetical protein
MPIYMLLEVGNINLSGKIESWTLLLTLFLPFFLVNNNGGSIYAIILTKEKKRTSSTDEEKT